MRTPETFDAFYASAREPLLLEAYALTGDLPSSRTAVRDAFAVAWHHWRTVSRSESPEAWLRPIVHTRAQRRHRAHFWHRDKSLEPELRETLDALASLTNKQRKVLVLASLSPLSIDEIARTVGLSRAETERELQASTSSFSIKREVPSTSVRTTLEQLRAPVAQTRWPRTTIVRRMGAARRRTHTVIGAVAVTAALVGAGSVVSTSGAETADLHTEPVTAGARALPAPGPPKPALNDSALLTTQQVSRFGKTLDWREVTTTQNLKGDGIVLPCQLERFADPSGVTALVRKFEGTSPASKPSSGQAPGKRGKNGNKTTKDTKQRRGTQGSPPAATDKKATPTLVTEMIELSHSERDAAAAYDKARSWYAGCKAPRTQLLETYSVKGMDHATVLSFRSWARKPSRFVIGVARTGQLIVSTAARGADPDPAAVARSLAAAVNRLCGTPGAGDCAGPAKLRLAAPIPVSDTGWLLSTVDLPPVSGATGPWTATDPQPDAFNLASTNCDRTKFTGKGITNSLSRDFVFLRSKDSVGFGVTETAARMKPAKAEKFVQGVRASLARCEEKALGTTVTSVANRSTKDTDLQIWRLVVEVSDNDEIIFDMAIMRSGQAVAQLGHSASDNLALSQADFVVLAERALARLRAMPSE